ncbi:GNAT family N-acetyltransferase [Neptunomonas concharum]|uniref:GNAT family N-acetyltransferase n=1 Tax=Neptunomonas concharum TaxID=1031538 RepID=UPI001FE8486A|nr:GNAT family N-acetyltransferase [Neptunomonas concharum]
MSSDDYTDAEREAWAPTPPDYDFWQLRCNTKRPFVAENKGKLVGFIELEEDGHIDCLYVAPLFQGQGIASALLTYARRMAKERNIGSLYVEASKPAKHFFESEGFLLTQVNKVTLRGETLINYTMVGQIELNSPA